MPGAKAAKCAICKLYISKTQGCIECNVCSKWVHGSCAKLSDSDLLALRGIKASAFICPVCEHNITNNRGSSGGASDDIRSLNLKLDAFMSSYHSDQSSLKTVLDDIKSEMKSCFVDIKNDISQCKDRIIQVEASTSSKISALEAENNALHRRLNRADFLLGGLPEGLVDLVPPVIAVGAVFNVAITRQDIYHVCYIHKKKQILVKLNSVALRDNIMREYFKSRTLRVCDVMTGPGSDITSRVYLNDHYTPAAGHLNSICMKLRRINSITKFKILNGDQARVKVMFPDGKETVLSVNECSALLNEPHVVN